MKSVNIIHCADAHIGSPLTYLGSAAPQRRAEILSALAKITAMCRENATELLLISGDLFDKNSIDKASLETVKASFASIPDTEIVIVPGNHDYICEGSVYSEAWSNNVVIFRQPGSFVYKNKARIYGIPFTEAYSDGFALPQAENDGLVNILVMHGDTDGGRYNPLTPQKIEMTRMNYVALGHIHKPSGILHAGSTAYAYSGSTAGLGFDETGKRGVICGTVNNIGCELEFVPIPGRVCCEIRTDISGVTDINGAVATVSAQLCSHENDIVKLILCGECDFSPDTAIIDTAVSPRPFFLKIKDRTHPSADLDTLAHEQSLKGIFVKKMLERMEGLEGSDRSAAENALQLGLAAFAGRRTDYDAD